ncbi:hypothetical protein [Flagellimonas onchidii]|uniref:hypothetical protein n=1 Tax=Flagellimonas onchidii TaxID=2562684 RepID=UPI0010A5CCD0|nr:hypothetical protein [Allomuricauda onchidii]
MMTEGDFKEIVTSIRKSDVYENHSNWEARGLNPSDKSIIEILRSSTIGFLQKLEEINESSESSDVKLVMISDMVDELPWFELDTEEKEFLADVLAPAIKAAGFTHGPSFKNPQIKFT